MKAHAVIVKQGFMVLVVFRYSLVYSETLILKVVGYENCRLCPRLLGIEQFLQLFGKNSFLMPFG